MKSASNHYKDLRSRARAKWEKKKKLDNRIGNYVWNKWIEEWKTLECQKKTELKSINRKGGAEGNDYPTTHNVGSASHRKIAAMLTLRSEGSQPTDDSLTPLAVDENQLFYDVVGGRDSRNRVYGLESSHDIYYEPSSSTLSHFISSSYPNHQDYQ
ncbi:hypothetical protein AgCh_022119 [Apium graveolens]